MLQLILTALVIRSLEISNTDQNLKIIDDRLMSAGTDAGGYFRRGVSGGERKRPSATNSSSTPPCCCWTSPPGALLLCILSSQ